MPAASCLPLAIVGNDPAFYGCVRVAVTTPELVEQFADQRKTRLARGQVADRDVRDFVAYVHREIYTRLSDGTLRALRARASGVVA